MDILSYKQEEGCIDITIVDPSAFLKQYYIHAHIHDFFSDISIDAGDEAPPQEVVSFAEWIVAGIRSSVRNMLEMNGLLVLYNSATGAVSLEVEGWRDDLLDALEESNGCDEQQLALVLQSSAKGRVWLSPDKQLLAAHAMADIHGMKLVPKDAQ